nr:neuropeptides B/W receptor type like [Tanacetum cinerariifolium]
MIFLSSCLVFHLVCNLQIIPFDDYGNLLERETDVLVFIEEHAPLRHLFSHRFRIYLLLVFIVVTSSQFATLFQITEFRDKVTFINGGDFAVSSIAQVVGVILCLNAAAKISHRAQGIAALASRWHALASCGPDNSCELCSTPYKPTTHVLFIFVPQATIISIIQEALLCMVGQVTGVS